MANLIGEAIDSYLSSQIDVRQKLTGKGLYDNPKLTNTDINLLNNKNAWLKLASSVYMGNPQIQKSAKEAGASSQQIDRLKTLTSERLRDIGLDINEMAGLNLAKKTVLFNTLSEWDSDKQEYIFRKGVLDKKLNKDSVWNSEFAYGLGSPSKGLVPPPGLLSLDIENLNRGSLKEANIEIKCFNQIQFQIIELVYLRLGYHMIIEWGWDKYVSDDENDPYQQVGNSIIENTWFQKYNGGGDGTNFFDLVDEIRRAREAYEGNYDGFVGKVVNFDWTMDKDGSFNIKLKLISVGDVIESLKTNLAISSQTLKVIKQQTAFVSNDERFAVTEEGDYKSIVVSKAAESTIHYDLFTDLINKNIKWANPVPMESFNREYLNIFEQGLAQYQIGKNTYNGTFYSQDDDEALYDEEIAASLDEEGFKQSLDDHYGYYVTMGQFLHKLKTLIIPDLSGQGIVGIDNDENSNLCAVFPNLISLDPRICYISPFLTETMTEGGGNSTFVSTTPLTALAGNKQFAFQESVSNQKGNKKVVAYGKIMNIYLNYEFIVKSLEDARDKSGNITIFKFLQKICDGINLALGGTTNLEITLRDDAIITIIDQNPIPGLKELFPQLQKDTVAKFNLFGFNRSESETTSNFVKDFSFTSKITPDMAAQISIGAASQGINTKDYDLSGFANFNKGIEDNFSYGYLDPIEKVDKTLKDPEESGLALKRFQVEKIWKNWKRSEDDLYNWRGRKRSKMKGYPGRTYFGGKSAEGFKDIEKCPITKKTYQNLTWEMYGNKVNNYVAFQRNKAAKENEAKEVDNKWKGDYLNYLVRAFGGRSQAGKNTIARYLGMDPNFIKEGMKAFKAYKAIVNNIAFQKTSNPSNQTGFIPLDLSVTCEGIGGFKMYNALNIDQSASSLLPYQYKNVVDFIITKVNHSISDNNWETKLESISVPRIEPPNPNEIDLYKIEEGVENPYNPGPDFTPTKQPWSAVFISYVMKQAGVKFPYASAHRIYANRLYDVAGNFRKDGNLRYKPVGSPYLGWRIIDPYRGTDGNTKNTIQDYFTPKKGDVFVYNRAGNTNVFTGGNYQGATHGDIITEVNGTGASFTARAIGGNLSDTSRFSPEVTQISPSYLNGKSSNKLFIVLRPPAAYGDAVAAKAVEEKNFWAGRDEKEANQTPEANNKLFERMTEYWNLVGIRAPQWGRDGYQTNVNDNFES